MARTLQLALPDGSESFPNINSHTLGTRSRVPQPLLGATKARDTELWEMAAIKNFRLSTNQNIIIRTSHSQLIQIVMKNTNVGLENPNPIVRTWNRIWLDIATNNQQQTQPIGKMNEEINFNNTHTKRIIDRRREVHLAELPCQVRLNNPQVRLGLGRWANVKGIPNHQPSHGPSVQQWSWRNRRKEDPELWPSGLEREVDCGRSVTQPWLQPKILTQGCRWL